MNDNDLRQNSNIKKIEFFIRDSQFSLVELTLLAKHYVENLNSVVSSPDQRQLLTQTMLRMKATEGRGILKVAIFDTDPVGFYWSFDSTASIWIDERFRNHGLQDQLINSVNGVSL